MKIADTRKAIEQALDTYRDLLDTFTDEQFAASPKGGGWSIAEVYSHILQATLGASIVAERCINGTCNISRKGPNLFGRLVLLLKEIPVKIKGPQPTETSSKITKISKEDARNLIIKCRRRVDVVAPRIAEESGIHKIKHPRFGMFNARQWFTFILVHLKHHLKQINRIKNKF